MGYQRELRQEITRRIAYMMKEAHPPWSSGHILSDASSGFPTNVHTKYTYTGINPLLLNTAAWERGYESKWWGTYGQWRKMRCPVKPRPTSIPEGQWGVKIVQWKSVQKTVGTKIECFRQMTGSTVFNAQQVTGPSVMDYRVTLKEEVSRLDADYGAVDGFIDTTKATIEHGHETPIYNRLPDDYIGMPDREKFLGNDPQYYAALFHEVFHWTEWRTGWTGTAALGELIAEIGTGLIETELGLPHCEDMTNHNKYLDEWLLEMESNPKYIFDAATQASRSLDFLLSFVQPRQVEAEPKGAYLE